jgi:hypothetical protein
MNDKASTGLTVIVVVFLVAFAYIKWTEICNKHDERLIDLYFKHCEHIKALENDAVANAANADKKKLAVVPQKQLENCS